MNISQKTKDRSTLIHVLLSLFRKLCLRRASIWRCRRLGVARNVSVQGVTQAGFSAIGGKARLLRREQLDADWDPSSDDRLCVWEATQHLINKLDVGGEASAAALLTQLKTFLGMENLPPTAGLLPIASTTTAKDKANGKPVLTTGS